MVQDAKTKKVQKSIHFTSTLFKAISQRAMINHRTISGEVEYMLCKQIESEIDGHQKAIAMAAAHSEQDQK